MTAEASESSLFGTSATAAAGHGRGVSSGRFRLASTPPACLCSCIISSDNGQSTGGNTLFRNERPHYQLVPDITSTRERSGELPR